MINSVSFMGRETMLTKPAKKVANEAQGFVGISKVYTKDEIVEAQKMAKKAKLADNLMQETSASSYTSPFAPIPNAAGKEAKSDIKHIDVMA